jgi:hypothetical protein
MADEPNRGRGDSKCSGWREEMEWGGSSYAGDLVFQDCISIGRSVGVGSARGRAVFFSFFLDLI